MILAATVRPQFFDPEGVREAGSGIPEQGDYFGAQINAPPAAPVAHFQSRRAPDCAERAGIAPGL
jgi:hypothetical protein